MNLLADLDPIERRLRQKQMPRLDQLRHVPEEKRQHQRHDVVAVAVGIHQQNDPVIPQTRQIEVRPNPRPQRLDQILQLLVLQQLRHRQRLGIQDLPA